MWFRGASRVCLGFVAPGARVLGSSNTRWARLAVLGFVCLVGCWITVTDSALADTPGPFVFRANPAGDSVGNVPSDITAIACSRGSLCVAVGNGNSLMTSTDPFGAWRVSSGQFPVLQNVQSISCPSDALCVAIENGSVDTSTDPVGGAATWTQKSGVVASGHFTGVSCPTTTLCVAVTSDGQVVSSTDPADGNTAVWTSVSLAAQLAGVSCSSATACVVAGHPSSGAGGLIYSTTTPTTTSATGWTPSAVSASVQGVTCPSETLCIGYENVGFSPSATGAVTISTNPVANSPNWSAAAMLVSGGWIDGVSCASSGQCVAVDSDGDVHATTNPGGGASAWNSAPLMSPLPIGAVTCVPGPFCVLTGGVNGQIWTSSAPTLGASSWSQANTAVPLYGVSCPSATFCAAVDDIGNVLTSSNPHVAPWQVTPATGATLLAVACPTTSLCVATDISGDVVTSTNPTGSSTAWTTTNIDGSEAIFGVSCPTTTFCAAGDDAGDVLTSTNPTGGTGSWSSMHIDGDAFINGISCPSPSFCVAVDDSGNVLVSTNPTGGAGAWHVTSADPGDALFAVSCVSEALCVAVDDIGNAVTSTDPASATPGWTSANVDDTALTAVSCPSTTTCVAVDDAGFEVNSINPTGSADEWTSSQVTFSGAPLWGVACPGSSFCEAVDGQGDVAAGGPTPSNLTPPTITGTSDQGAALTIQAGTWTDSPTSLQHQWERCDASGANCADVANATAGQYRLTAADVGHTIRVLELASNANGDGATVESQQTGVVKAPPPTGPSTPSTPSGPGAPAGPIGGTGNAIIKSAITRGTSASVRVSCAGSAGATCSLALRMTVRETLKGGKVVAITAKAKPKRKLLIVGTTTVKLAAGQSKIVKVSLNSIGKRLLSPRHRLKVTLRIIQSSKIVFSRTLTFKSTPNKKR